VADEKPAQVSCSSFSKLLRNCWAYYKQTIRNLS